MPRSVRLRQGVYPAWPLRSRTARWERNGPRGNYRPCALAVKSARCRARAIQFYAYGIHSPRRHGGTENCHGGSDYSRTLLRVLGCGGKRERTATWARRTSTSGTPELRRDGPVRGKRAGEHYVRWRSPSAARQRPWALGRYQSVSRTPPSSVSPCLRGEVLTYSIIGQLNDPDENRWACISRTGPG